MLTFKLANSYIFPLETSCPLIYFFFYLIFSSHTDISFYTITVNIGSSQHVLQKFPFLSPSFNL